MLYCVNEKFGVSQIVRPVTLAPTLMVPTQAPTFAPTPAPTTRANGTNADPRDGAITPIPTMAPTSVNTKGVGQSYKPPSRGFANAERFVSVEYWYEQHPTLFFIMMAMILMCVICVCLAGLVACLQYQRFSQGIVIPLIRREGLLEADVQPFMIPRSHSFDLAMEQGQAPVLFHMQNAGQARIIDPRVLNRQGLFMGQRSARQDHVQQLSFDAEFAQPQMLTSRQLPSMSQGTSFMEPIATQRGSRSSRPSNVIQVPQGQLWGEPRKSSNLLAPGMVMIARSPRTARTPRTSRGPKNSRSKQARKYEAK